MHFASTLADTFVITVFGVAGILLVSSMAAWKLVQRFIIRGTAAGAVKG